MKKVSIIGKPEWLEIPTYQLIVHKSPTSKKIIGITFRSDISPFSLEVQKYLPSRGEVKVNPEYEEIIETLQQINGEYLPEKELLQKYKVLKPETTKFKALIVMLKDKEYQQFLKEHEQEAAERTAKRKERMKKIASL